MTRNIKTLFTLVFTCCFLLSIPAVQAGSDCCCSSCECGPDCFCHFPNYSPCCSSVGDGFLATFEFLWWKPCFNDLDYAIKFDTQAGSPDPTIGEYRYPPHQFSPGFRVGLDLDNLWCGWDLFFHYEWIQEKASRQDDSNTGFLASTLWHGGLNDNIDPDNLDSSHKFQYQTFDIMFGKECLVNPCSRFVPFFGLQGVKLDQTWKSAGNELSNNASLRWDSCYEGLGLAVGVEYFYKMSCVEFFTNAKLMGVRGCNVSKYQYEDLFGEDPTTRSFIFKTDDSTCVPGLHLRAGINYVYEYCDTELLFTIGYEFVNWFNMPRIRRFSAAGDEIGISTNPNGSRVGFHGLSVGLGFSM